MTVHFHWRVFALSAVAFLLTAPGYAIHHQMQIEQVIGAVDGDTTAQAVQLRIRSGGQNILGGSKLFVYDAAGANPVLLFDFNSSVSNGSSGDRVLLTTAAFDALCSPAADSDFTLTNRIPDAYFAAGRITFEEDDGTVLWALAWGGASYTGLTTGDNENDADGNFGTPFPTALPNDIPVPEITVGLLFSGLATALSTTNAADYQLTVGNPSVTNNARVSFDVDGGPKSITVTKPASGNEFHMGDKVKVKWNSTGVLSNKVKLDLYRGSTRVESIGKTKNDGSVNWTVPHDLDAGTNYQIRVQDKANGVSDKSDTFTIGSH